MQDELLLWAGILLAGLFVLWVFFYLSRRRQRRKWRSKRPIHVTVRDVGRPPAPDSHSS